MEENKMQLEGQEHPDATSGERFSQEVKEDKERRPKFEDLMLVTSTLYKDLSHPVVRARMEAAVTLFERAKDLQIKCSVLDGGSDPEFTDKLQALGNVELVIDPKLGIGESRRKAFSMAMAHSEIQFFLNMEPEKIDVIKEQPLEQVISELRSKQADIVMINRAGLQDKNSPVSESMVELQRWFEARANKRANELLQGEAAPEKQLDIWFSVEMMNRDGAKYFVDYSSPSDKWDAMVGPIFDAYRHDKKIVGVDADIKYDPQVTEAEKQDDKLSRKRIIQYGGILGAMQDPFWKEKQTTWPQRFNRPKE